MAAAKVSRPSDAQQVGVLLDSPEITALVTELEATRWTGRPGYPIRGLIGMALAKSIYAMPTWTKTVALVREHTALRVAVTQGSGDVPSVYACYRFAAKLRQYGDILARCIDRVTASLGEQLPEYGRNVAIDGSDMPVYANGQRFVSKNGPERERYSDPDASWGHRSAVSTRKGGGFYGYKLDAAVCTATDLPVAWDVRTARENESLHALPLIDTAKARGFAVDTAALDKRYDAGFVYDGCEARDVRQIIPLKETPGVKRGDHRPPRVSMASGGSPEPTTSARRQSGAAPLGSASPPPAGSRRTACIPDSARDAPLDRAVPPPCRR